MTIETLYKQRFGAPIPRFMFISDSTISMLAQYALIVNKAIEVVRIPDQLDGYVFTVGGKTIKEVLEIMKS